MNQTKAEVLELKMTFLNYMKLSKYNEAHDVIQQILKIDPQNPLIGKCDKFFSQFKQKLIEKEKELEDDDDSSEEEQLNNDDEVDPNDVPDLEDTSEHTWDEKLFEKQKKIFKTMLPNIPDGDPKAVVEAIKKAKELALKEI